MDILKIATEWAKDEVFSSRFFILLGILFVIATIGFWQLGKSEVAKAYVIPTLVAGILLLAVGTGIYFANKARVTSFEVAYNENQAEFIQSEIARTEKSMGEYRNIVFKVIPVIIAIAALLLIFLPQPVYRAICTTTIAMMVVIVFVDGNANARLLKYHDYLIEASK